MVVGEMMMQRKDECLWRKKTENNTNSPKLEVPLPVFASHSPVK